MTENLPSSAQAFRSRVAKCKDLKSLRVKNNVLGEATDAETDVEGAVVRVGGDAVSRAGIPRTGDPRAAAQQLETI